MKNTSFNSDKIGMISSFLCLVHCLTLPTLISFQPIIAGFLTEDLFYLEYMFLAMSFVAAFYSSRNASILIKISFMLTLTLFTVSFFLEKHASWLHYLTYLGSLGLIITHLINYYRCRECEVIPSELTPQTSRQLFLRGIYTTHKHRHAPQTSTFQNMLE